MNWERPSTKEGHGDVELLYPRSTFCLDQLMHHGVQVRELKAFVPEASVLVVVEKVIRSQGGRLSQMDLRRTVF